MAEISLKKFLSTAPPDDIEAFVEKWCGGNRDYMSQLKTGHRKMGWRRAKEAVKWFASIGYTIPKHKIRPDIWSAPK